MVAIEKFFSNRPNWHEAERVNPLVRQYQTTLDSLLESHRELKCRVKHCLDCGIRFLAAPQNAGREDLRCPFGCAKGHRARQSNERVKAYRRTPAGKRKKDALNARRYRQASSTPGPSPRAASASSPPPSSPPADPPLVENPTSPLLVAQPADVALDLQGIVLDQRSIVHSPMLPYIRTLLGMIEGVRWSHVQVAWWLQQVQRQRSMASRPRREYVLHFLHRHPP